ncbi:MAG: hypothetical protein U0798_08930 [Gemmataceae bacterium]
MSATAASTKQTTGSNGTQKTQEVESITIRFAGDSGDGMQLAGTQFTNTAAVLGNDIATFPTSRRNSRPRRDARRGLGFQVHFSSRDIHTPGDVLNALVVMNPAASRPTSAISSRAAR